MLFFIMSLTWKLIESPLVFCLIEIIASIVQFIDAVCEFFGIRLTVVLESIFRVTAGVSWAYMLQIVVAAIIAYENAFITFFLI